MLQQTDCAKMVLHVEFSPKGNFYYVKEIYTECACVFNIDLASQRHSSGQAF